MLYTYLRKSKAYFDGTRVLIDGGKTFRDFIRANKDSQRLIKKLTGERMVGKNLGGSLGAAIWCAFCGASILRVHDVRETRQVRRGDRLEIPMSPSGGFVAVLE